MGMKLKAKSDNIRSWEKQDFYKLENGCQLITGYSPHYGPMVHGISDGEGKWHCSNGHAALPERFAWAREWIKPIAPGHWQTIMVPDLEVA